jgi:hypothetical protein
MSHSHHQLSGIRNGDCKNKGRRSTIKLVSLELENKAIKKLRAVQPVLQSVDEFMNWNKTGSTFSVVSLLNISSKYISVVSDTGLAP